MRESPLPKLLLTMEEAAAALNIGRTLFYRLVGQGEISTIKIGKCRRVPVKSLEAFIDAQLAGEG